MFRGISIQLIALLMLLASAEGAREDFVLIGRLVDSNGRAFRGVISTAFIRSAVGVFSKTKLIGAGGEFKVGGLKPGLYVVAIKIPGYGDVKKSVEVGPSFADDKGRVEVTIKFGDENRIPVRPTVSATQLSIPPKAYQHYEKARKRLEKSDAQGAIIQLKKALVLAPAFAAAWNLLGTIEYKSENYSEAEKDFREALAHDPEYYAPLVNLGAAVLILGKVEEAVSLNLKASGLRPEDPLAHSQLGQSYLALGELEASEKHLKIAKNLDPNHFSMPQLFLGEIYRRLGREDSQIAELEEFIQYHPDSDMTAALQKVLDELKARK